MNEADRQKNNIPDGIGVYVMNVANGSSADEVGIQKGDFITKLNGVIINAGTELVGKISAFRPGDKIELTYMRNGVENNTTAVLKGSAANYPQQQQAMEPQQQDQQNPNQ